MQTKKRISGRIASQDHVSPKASRPQKKVSEKVQGPEKKVTEIITSSVRKKKPASTLPKKNEVTVEATNLNARYGLLHDDASDACLGFDVVNGVHVDHTGTDQHMTGTIFSPGFHIPKICGAEIACAEVVMDSHTGETLKYTSVEEIFVVDTNPVICTTDSGAVLSSEVSAIYMAMKNSKLECVDEHGQDSMSTDVCVEDEYYEEFDDFDPYLFIKNLPELSSLVPAFRPVLLPKQTRSCPPTTLVLDLDETLVHSSLEPCDDADFTFPVNFNLQEHTVYVKCRPHLRDFMEWVYGLFEIIIFTASQSIYAEQLLNVLDPKRRVFRRRVFRESCVLVDGNYLKDLSVLGRDLARVIIIDNSPQAFGFQVDNGIPIESWFDDRSDRELLSLLPFLESLVGVEDVRPLIAKKFNLREKVAAAVYPHFNLSRRDLLKDNKATRTSLVRVAAILLLVCAANLYEFAKQNSGPLQPTVGIVEGAVMTIIGPVYEKFKDAPDHLLGFLDTKVDEAMHKFDEHVPPAGKEMVNQAQYMVHTTAQKAQKLVDEARTNGARGTLNYAASEYKQFVLVISTKLWVQLNYNSAFHSIAKVVIPVAKNLSEKYNCLIKDMSGKGYPVFKYLPLIPVAELSKAVKQAEAKDKKHVHDTRKSDSDSDSNPGSGSDSDSIPLVCGANAQAKDMVRISYHCVQF
ncbi:CTD small phosphatase-like protein 2 [Hibiscus syriacus]|uniref:CTD small phosphatase-like protein 2 n=1 Tax=Hibiscus syriacus TaxID=106335 RepID=A0A6A2Z7S2_HIBSY|nr:CTD small phosphatase-like protein 2 [Hibiscus syriacus]